MKLSNINMAANKLCLLAIFRKRNKSNSGGGGNGISEYQGKIMSFTRKRQRKDSAS